MRTHAALSRWNNLPDEALTSRQTVALLLECSERTVLRMEADGRLKRHASTGQVRYTVGDVRRMLQAR